MLSTRNSMRVAYALFLCCLTGVAVGQGTDHFTINIPKKTTSPFLPITLVEGFVGLSKTIAVSGSVTFAFTDEHGVSRNIVCSTTACTPSPSTSACPAPDASWVCFPLNNNETGAAGGDRIQVLQVSGPTEDPVRYEIHFKLLSNFTITSSNTCVNTQFAALDTYTVKVSSANSNEIMGVCLESFDGLLRPNTNACTAANHESYEIPIPLDSANDPVATVDSQPQPSFACYQGKNARPSLDVVMVLDKSGSMSIKDDSSTTSRIDALQSAVGSFLDTWAGLSPSSDDVGIVTFSTSPTLQTALQDVKNNASSIKTTVNATCPSGSICPDGSTSIGGGLNTANPLLPPASGRRKVILLMTDGQQNTDPWVEITSGTNPSIALYCKNSADPLCTIPATCTLANPCPLSNLPQVYTVTLGPSQSVDPGIQQAIGNLTHSFYLNSEENPSLLSPFFMELLQNFVRFNSYETVRMIHKAETPPLPFSTTMPISTTSHDAVFSLMWPSQFGPLRMTVTPPGAAQAIVRQGASGFVSLVVQLPLPAPFDPPGDWKVTVDAAPAVGIRAGAGGSNVPFDLHVTTDDAGIKSELSVVPSDYTAGDDIRLRAKLAFFGVPIRGLGSHPGDTIKVEPLAPGKSVGDALSDSSARSTPPPPPTDIQAGAEAKLFNMLQSDPLVLKRIGTDAIQLYDDGKPEHGDDVAGDGIYSALYPATTPGHYNFLFSVESTDPNSVRFSRQQLRTAYVRAVPDAGNTVFQTSIVTRDNRNVLNIVMTPRVKPGPGCLKNNPKCGRMGPGWANYFWFTTPGRAPFKATDDLKGNYTATLSFTGSNPPSVDIHFENVLAVIGDSVTSDELPDPLGQGNVLVHDCCRPKGTGRFALFLDGGGNFPQGTFGTGFNNGFSLNAGLEYIAISHLSLEGIFGYHRFPGTIMSDLNVYQFSANAKVYLMPGRVQPFINGGIGGYRFSPGSGSSATHFGGNVGAGVLFNLTPRFGLQGSYNFHAVNTPSEAKFSTAQFGIRFVF